MKFIKKWIQIPRIQYALSTLGALYLKFVFRTSRFHFVNQAIFDALTQDDKPFIVTFWHGRMAMLPCGWPVERPVYMLLSKHRDGKFISTLLRHFNIQSIDGSTNRGGVDRGGARAARKIIDLLKQGYVVGVTPDGPRGPSQICAKGIIDIALLYTKATLSPLAILPCSYSMNHHKRLSSWDRFMMPFPFSKGVFSVEEPLWIYPPHDHVPLPERSETYRLTLEEYLNNAQQNADDFIKKMQ